MEKTRLHQMTQFWVVHRRSSTAASFWCRKSRRFRKALCWFAEVRQSMKSTNTLSVFVRIILSSFIPENDCAAVGFGGLIRTSPNQANAHGCCSDLRRSPLALGFPAEANQMFRQGKSGTSVLLALNTAAVASADNKAELPVLPRWRQQRDVLPQRIAIQGQWLLPSALSRAENRSGPNS